MTRRDSGRTLRRLMSPTTDDAERRLSQAGAFVVQFLAGSDVGGGNVGGRVEHVASGRSLRFASIDELLRFFGDVLSAVKVS